MWSFSTWGFARQLSMFNEQALFELGSWLRATGYCFITVTPATHARVRARIPRGEAKSLRDIFGWSMAFRPSLLPATARLLLERGGALEAAGQLLRSRVRFSTLGDSLYMHSAYPTADADAVFFGPDTHRFAALIQRTLGTAPGLRVDRLVDVGCGGGAGGIVAVRALRSEPSEVVLADINATALQYAAVNVSLAGIMPVTFSQGDLFNGIAQPIDLIVANPPYLCDPEARLYRNGGGELGSELSTRIVVEGLPRLRAGGALILYTGAPVVDGLDTFWCSVAPIVRDAGVRYDYAELDPDVFGEELENPAYAHVERIAVVGLVIRKP